MEKVLYSILFLVSSCICLAGDERTTRGFGIQGGSGVNELSDARFYMLGVFYKHTLTELLGIKPGLSWQRHTKPHKIWTGDGIISTESGPSRQILSAAHFYSYDVATASLLLPIDNIFLFRSIFGGSSSDGANSSLTTEPGLFADLGLAYRYTPGEHLRPDTVSLETPAEDLPLRDVQQKPFNWGVQISENFTYKRMAVALGLRLYPNGRYTEQKLNARDRTMFFFQVEYSPGIF